MTRGVVSPEGMEEFLSPEVQEQSELIDADALVSMLDGTDSTGQARRDSLSGQLAASKGRLLDEQEIALAQQQPDPAAALAQSAEELFQTLEREITDTVVSDGVQNGTPSDTIVPTLNAGREHVNNLRNHPTAEELATIQNAATVTLDAAVHEELSFNLGVRNELARILDEQGMFDMVMDIGGMFIPTRHTMEWEDIKDNVGSNKKLGQFMTGDSIAGMISSWQSLSLSRKKALYPALMDTILKSTGIEGGPATSGNLTDTNTQMAVAAIVRFFQPEGAERASIEQKALLGLDILSVLPAISQIGKLGKSGNAFRFSKAGDDVPTGPNSPVLEGEILGKATAEVNTLPVEVRKAMEGTMMDAALHAARNKNLVNILTEAGDKPQAARVNVSALDSESIRRVVGISTDDAIANALPFQTNGWLPQVTKDLAPDVAKEINDFHRIAENKVRSMTTESDLLRLGALSTSERAVAKRTFLEEVERVGEDYLMEGIHLSEVKIVKEDAHAFEFEYTLTNATGFVEPHKGRRSWGINQVTGTFEETTKDLAENAIIPGLSPSAWSLMGTKNKPDFGDAVKQAIQLEDIAVATKQRINELNIEASNTISGLGDVKARQRVEDIELAGDEYVNPDGHERGRNFLPRELYKGINTARGTIRLTEPKEVAAYYKRRLLADSLHAMQNYLSRRELELAQFKSYIIGTPAGVQQLFIKPFDNLRSALQSVSSKEGYGVFDHLTREVLTINEAVLTEAYDRGQVLGRLREDWNTSGNELSRGGEHVEYVLLDPNQVQQLPEQVLNYKAGYVPKLNEHVEFVVQQVLPKRKRGISASSERTEALRTFSSRNEANTFINRLAQQYATKYGIPLDAAASLFKVGDGSLMGQLERMENALSGSAGLVTGHRSKDDLLMGLEGVPMERMSPSEAYGRNIDQLGNRIAKNEWRIGKEKVWLNGVAKADPSIKIEGFNGTRLPDNDLGRALERERQYINQVNSIPSRKETLFEANVQKFHDWAMDGTNKLGVNKNNIKSILWLKHAEPAAAVKAASMHTFLGGLNPAQLYVQASAMTVALSLTPIVGIPNIAKNTALFGLYDNIRNENVIGKTAQMLSGAEETQMTTAEKAMYTAWRRSGLQEAVRGNADLGYISSTGLGLTNDVIRKAGNMSLLTYRVGDTLNRRVSFITAYTNWSNANKGKQVVTDDELSEVLVEANKFMLELNAANAAYWQGGRGATAGQKILGVATQFQQVLTKAVELAVKSEKRGGLSKKQVARVMSGQLLVLGAAGVPPIAMFGPAFMDWVFEESELDTTNPEDVDTMKELANIFNQGVAGFIALSIFGAEVDIASRASLAGGILETAKDIITSEDPMWLKLMGVSGVLGQRVGQAAQGTYAHALVALAKLEPLFLGDRTGTEKITTAQWKAVTKDIAALWLGVPSVTRSILKGRMMQKHDIILNARGGIKIKDDFNLATERAVMLGFTPSAETRLFKLQSADREDTLAVRGAADVIIQAYNRYLYLHQADPAHADSVRFVIQEMQETLDNPNLVEELRSSLEHRIFNNPQTDEERAILRYFNRHVEDNITQGLIMDHEGIINPGNLLNQQAVTLPFADAVKGTSDTGEE